MFYVSASARFLRIREEKHGHVWYMNDSDGKINALLVHHRQSLLPVFNKNRNIPGPGFLTRFLGKVQIHALQGLREDAELLESLMEEQGYYASERIDYDLMSLDETPRPEALRSGPPGLVLRSPARGDTEFLFALQTAYEQEEVLPRDAIFNPSVCRHNLDHILSSEYILVAELNGQVVGKINTSAESFTRYQIGGVYVRPDCRGRGIAAKMTAIFVQNLLTAGKGITLFVKKRNIAARAVYRRAGFSVSGDYRISYY
jgi:ribosomal protein S18 acetylase RimI-like enzyme